MTEQEKDVADLVRESVRKSLSGLVSSQPTTRESLAASVAATMNRILPSGTSDVSVTCPYEEQTEEEKTVREVMEEPLDPTVFVVSATYQHFAPMQYVSIELNIGDPEK